METIRIKALSGSAGTPPASIKARSGIAGTPPVSIKARSGSAGTASLSRPIKALSGSAGTAPASIKALSGSAGIPSAHRSAFTLVELLVVIGIIALLAAIVTPAVMRAQATARNAAIKAEIDMLHMAIMNYKNEYGSFPPCADSSIAAKHLARLFPRIPAGNISAELTAMTYAPPSGTSNLSPQTALRFWLTGYGSNPTSPVQGGDRKKLYDFDQSRFPNSSLEYYFPNSQSVDAAARSYVYFDANSTNGYASIPAGGVAYRMDFNNNPPSQSTSYVFFNPETFQIICSGRDGTFFTDDDLSNMWPGTWGDWKQSNKQ